MELLCYVPVPTSRIQYTFDFIFEEVLGVQYSFTSSIDALMNWCGPKMTYHTSRVSDRIYHLPATGLLAQNKINENLATDVITVDGLPAVFPTEEGDFKFDLPSFVFYNLSRYEEYTSSERDRHGRFISGNSIAVKYDFLELPIVDIWIARWGKEIKARFPDLHIPLLDDLMGKGRIELTFDIDFPWAFQFRHNFANIGGAFKDLLRWDWPHLSKRLQVMTGRSPDPYDQYDFILSETKKRNIQPLFFLLNRDGTTFDRNHFIHRIEYHVLIQKLESFSKLGIHPSYYAMNQGDLMRHEIKCLEQRVQGKISKARMHFLRMKLPETYRLLYEQGIRTDYTMGYADRAGFRSGTSYKHQWFDLALNRRSELNLVPLICMDTTFHDYLGLTPEQAQKKMTKLMDWVWLMRGNCAILWHNSSLSGWGAWKGWRKVFLETLPEEPSVSYDLVSSIRAGSLILK